MAGKTGQVIGRGARIWLVRVYVRRDAVTKKRKYLNKTVHGRLRNAQAHLSSMHSERDLGRKIESSKQTLNQYLDCSLGDLRDVSLDDGRRAHALPRRVVEESIRLRVTSLLNDH